MPGGSRSQLRPAGTRFSSRASGTAITARTARIVRPRLRAQAAITRTGQQHNFIVLEFVEGQTLAALLRDVIHALGVLADARR